MTDLNMDKLENEAMARAYNVNKPDELNNEENELHPRHSNVSFFKISQLIESDDEEQVQLKQCFREIKMLDCEWKCHFGLLINYNFGVLIPSKYIIEYNSSSNNNIERGIIRFRHEREYVLEYEKSSKDDFENRMHELAIVSSSVESFIIGKQNFYEFEDGYIYMYYDNYIWKVFGYSRNDIKEYYDMYGILMSISRLNSKNYTDNDSFKRIYLMTKNCLNYLYQGIDLRKKTKEEFESYNLDEDVVTFSIDNNRYLILIDEDYQLFNRKIKDDNNTMNKLHIYHDEKWCFNGAFKAGFLGIFNFGYLLDFPEIVDSKELSEIEKRVLLENIVNQKQIELCEYKDLICEKVLNIFIDNLSDDLTLDKWNKLELINYLRIEDMKVENKTEELLYNSFRFELDNSNIEAIKNLIDIDYFESKIKPKKIMIGPEFIAFSCKIFDDNKIFILFENNEFIEWK